MNKKFKFASAVLSAGLLITPVFGLINHYDNIANAQENKTNISSIDFEKLKLELTQNNVPNEKIKNLIDKLNKSIPWDNMTDKQPIKNEKYTDNKKIIEKNIYEDGSYIIQTIDLSKASINKTTTSFRSITGGNYNSGSGWRSYNNVSVSKKYGAINFGFFANYEQYSNGYGKITSVYGDWYTVAGVASNRNLTIGLSYGQPAHATLTFDYSTPLQFFSKNMNLTLYVDGYNAWDAD